MTPMDIDSDTLGVALQLQLNNIEDIRDKKGKARGGEMSDFQLAIESYQNELAIHERYLFDLALARSIAMAVETDGDLIDRLAHEERQAAHDRRVAMALDSGGHPAETLVEVPANAPSGPDHTTLGRLAALNGYEVVDPDTPMANGPSDLAESSSWASKRTALPAPQIPMKKIMGKCDSCQELVHVDSLSRCSCSHSYCSDCLGRLVQASLADERLFPPRCCRQDIPISPGVLPPTLMGQFKAKQVEYGCKERTYCHEPSCSTFVPPQFIKDDVAVCVKCYRRTCTRCKGPTHDRECPLDTEAQQVLQVATENGWQRCYSCGRLVELVVGCNHMTCLCRAEFCYVCGLQWKTCQCAVWDEARLVARANERVDRNVHVGQPVNEQARADAVERARQDILENHECDHERWKSIAGPEECDECGDFLEEFIYECQQCEMLACRNCKRHRL